jgi:trimeric autotransporter adhesin
MNMNKLYKFLLLLTISLTIFIQCHAQGWSALGNGINYPAVRAMTSFGNNLYAAGDYNIPSGNTTPAVHVWDGTTWSAAGYGLISDSVGPATINTLIVFNNELYAGGVFNIIGGDTASCIAKWTGTNWVQVGNGLNSYVHTMVIHNGSLYAAGSFSASGSTPVNHIARWDGFAWVPVGSGITAQIWALASYNGDLYAGAEYTLGSWQYMQKWDGTTWTGVGTGMNDAVYSLATYNNKLYAGGNFTLAGGVPVQGVASWDGTAWNSVAGNINGTVSTFTVLYNELFAGGIFYTAGGSPANNVARFNGTQWLPLGTGINYDVFASCVHKDELYFGGAFTMAGGIFAKNIARYVLPVGISENKFVTDVLVSPNPSEGNFIINSNYQFNGYTIFDITGKIIRSGDFPFQEMELKLFNESNGLYFLELYYNQDVIRRRLILY